MRALGWLLPLVVIAIMVGVLVLYLLAVAALDGFDNLRIRRALRTLPVHDARAATLTLATALLRMLAPRSFVRRPDWTLREYADQLATVARTDAHQSAIAIPREFIEAFDAACYGSAASTAGSLSSVIQLVREQLRSNPWPRLRAATARLPWAWHWPRLRSRYSDEHAVDHRRSRIGSAAARTDTGV